MRILSPLLGVSASLLLAAVAARSDGQAFVAGDLIVRFTAASDAGALVARAVQGDPAAERDLPALAARLTRELGVAVAAVRVTSGNELVLSVDRDRLLESLTAVVTRDPAVRRVRRIEPPKTVLPAARLELAVTFRFNSEASRLVRDSARAGIPVGREIEALVQRLCAGADPQPVGRVDDRGRLVLAVDVAALTLDLVERLKRRPDVEYAQPSHIVKPFAGGSSGAAGSPAR